MVLLLESLKARNRYINKGAGRRVDPKAEGDHHGEGQMGTLDQFGEP